MRLPRISPFHRTLAAIAVALALPTVLVIALQMSFSFQRQKADNESASLRVAEEVSGLTDARLRSDLSAMRVLATSNALAERNWESFAGLAERVVGLNEGWKSVLVSDLTADIELYDHATNETPAAPQTRQLSQAVTDPTLYPGEGPGGVAREGLHCPCVYVHTTVPDPVNEIVLTMVLDPQVFQDILAPRTPDGAVSAIVDGEGNFIARAPAFAERVGTPATQYVQSAVAAGGSGVYDGVTYEGLDNVTAYHTSGFSGWSPHIAVNSAIVDSPQIWANRTLIGGALIAIIVAIVGIALALYSLAEGRREEERLRQAQKLEALGRLTGGVAHDFNNLLTVIIGGLGMLLPRQMDERSRRWAQGALEAAQRGARLTEQLLAFSRGQTMEIAPVDLVALLERMRELLRHSIGPDVVLEYDIDPEHYWVRTDANQLELAILNLAINARDAMPSGGTLNITVRPSPKRGRLDILATDSGEGMSKEVLARAMEPFFTTKADGAGTGLGLAQVFGAIQQSGGEVNITSTPGSGTTVVLTLPESDPVGLADSAVENERSEAGSGRSRVIVVDDETGVRDIMAEILRNAGYSVVEASDGETALSLVRSEKPDLMVTDFAMPGMNGAALIKLARQERKSLKTLIVSGHADIEAVEAARADAPLLRKPFAAEDLVAAVRTALAA